MSRFFYVLSFTDVIPIKYVYITLSVFSVGNVSHQYLVNHYKSIPVSFNLVNFSSDKFRMGSYYGWKIPIIFQ